MAAEFATVVNIANITGAAASSISASHDMGLFNSTPNLTGVKDYLNSTLDYLQKTYQALIHNADFLTAAESQAIRVVCNRIISALYDSSLDLAHVAKKKRYLIWKNRRYEIQLDAATKLQVEAEQTHMKCLQLSSEGAARYSERKKILEKQRETRDAKKMELEDQEIAEKLAKFRALAKLKSQLNVPVASRRERVHNPFMGPDEATQAWQSTPELVRDRQSYQK